MMFYFRTCDHTTNLRYYNFNYTSNKSVQNKFNYHEMHEQLLHQDFEDFYFHNLISNVLLHCF